MHTQTITQVLFSDGEAQTDPIIFGHIRPDRSQKSVKSPSNLKSNESESYKRVISGRDGSATETLNSEDMSSDTDKSV
jgi:hypothetical protein